MCNTCIPVYIIMPTCSVEIRWIYNLAKHRGGLMDDFVVRDFAGSVWFAKQ